MESTKKKPKPSSPLPTPSPTADSSGGGGGDGDDRISALQDDLCELILRLARLDVKELVRTSVLSKRWRGLWKRAPVLDFFGWPEHESATDVQRYIAVVNHVLEQRAGATSEARIDELKIPLLFRAFRGNQLLWTPAIEAAAMEAAKVWIRYAMHQVKVFQFNLYLRPMQGEEIPVMDLDELLHPSSPKLECLHLDLGCREVRLPHTAVFTSLKDLTLESMVLVGVTVNLLAHLLSSVCCPILQKLCIRSVFFDAATNELVLEAGELLELSIESVYGMDLLELRTPKLLYLKINECHYLESLRISASGLMEINYFNDNTAFIQGRLPCVQRLNIDLFTYMAAGDDNGEGQNRSAFCLLKLCSSSVRCLHVHLYVPLVEEGHVDLIKDNIPLLPNVTSLLVSIVVPCEQHSLGVGVAGLLTRCKNLEYLSLVLDNSQNYGRMEDEYYYSYYLEGADVEPAFSCNHPDHWELSNIYLAQLRVADFRGMSATGCEFRFLQFVLASATNLQSVTVSFNLHLMEEVQDSKMFYFLNSLLGDGTWTTLEDEDLDNKPYNYSKLYKWTPSP